MLAEHKRWCAHCSDNLLFSVTNRYLWGMLTKVLKSIDCQKLTICLMSLAKILVRRGNTGEVLRIQELNDYSFTSNVPFTLMETTL